MAEASNSDEAQSRSILIIGCGIAGLAAALSLTKFLPNRPSITILEARDVLSSQGGTINVIPSGMRYLDALDVLPRLRERHLGIEARYMDVLAVDTGLNTGAIRFSNPDGSGIGDPPFTAWRFKRMDMLQAMLDQAESLANVKVKFGKKVKQVEELDARVTVLCEDGSAEHGDMVLGCDGIHSAVRRHIDAARAAEYTGLAVVNGFADAKNDPKIFKPGAGALAGLKSQQGSMLVSFYESTRTKLSITGVWENPDAGSRDGWRVRGTDQAAIAENLKKRFGGGGLEGVDALIDAVDSWNLYPVYKLPAGGRWSANRIMLLGDAAHAMPPQGESTTIAMEDGIVFARFLARQHHATLSQVFAAYERYRRVRIDAAQREAERRFGWNKNVGWLTYQISTIVRAFLLWWYPSVRRPVMEMNVTTEDLDGLDDVK